jgi:hypothetical protein
MAVLEAVIHSTVEEMPLIETEFESVLLQREGL